MRPGRLIRWTGLAGACALALALLAWQAAIWLDKAYPPPLAGFDRLSPEVTDRKDRLLRAFVNPDGRWRLPVTLSEVDPDFIDLLISYEDRRFYHHPGIDPIAMGRALWQMALHRRIVSGGSTITMQTARLLEPRPDRTVGAKILQMARALQLERRLSKTEILQLYLTLAPYGGNLEGVRSATLSYFSKEPAGLSLEEMALLVALPQSPETRRPDRFPERARDASLRVIERAALTGLIAQGERDRVADLQYRARKHPLPSLAPHLARRALQGAPDKVRISTSLVRPVQQRLQRLAAGAAKRIGANVSVAIVMADSRDGSVLAEVGSADIFDASRDGWIDMTTAVRSPGSTLKPFIYGLAFQEGLVMPETVIADRPADFSGYRPQNFDMTFQGDVTVRRALQMSLNVPAVRLLEGVGPQRLTAMMRRAGAAYSFSGEEAPGLSVGLGGLGMSLKDLVQLYCGLAVAPGRALQPLNNGVDPVRPGSGNGPLMEAPAIWHVTDILRELAPPAGSANVDIAYKTGTSYGYRDAWAVGYDGRYVIGVWVGRPDNGAVPGLTGFTAAAPVLFDAFVRSGVDHVAFRPAPAGAVRLARQELPPAMRFYRGAGEAAASHATLETAPHIAYPPAGARIALSQGRQAYSPLIVKLQGGRPPFRWLANGRPLEEPGRRRNLTWMPDGPGSANILVIDAAGRTARVDVFVE